MADGMTAVYVWAAPAAMAALDAWHREEVGAPAPALPPGAPFLAYHAQAVGRYRPFELERASAGGGQALGVLLDEYGQLIYDRFVDGARVRGLTCFPEGDGWVRVEGQAEAWEAAAFGEAVVEGARAPRPREATVLAALDACHGLPPRDTLRDWRFW